MTQSRYSSFCGWVRPFLAVLLLITAIRKGESAVGLDQNKNGLNDIWEWVFQAGSLPPSGDADQDGFTNAAESLAGTNPFDATSLPSIRIESLSERESGLSWERIPGKRYRVLSSTNLLSGSWAAELETNSVTLPDSISNFRFFRLEIGDTDSDGDGLSDYEEQTLGFSPGTSHSERFPQTDLQRVTNGLAAASIVTISAMDPYMSERWPDPGLIVIRRRGGMAPLNINLSLGGTATPGIDYTTPGTTNVLLPAGAREVWIEFKPVADLDDSEPAETISVTLQPGSGYTLGTNIIAVLNLENQTAAGPPGAKEAARFLIQASFGPDQDSPDDSDQIPENVEEVMAVGIDGWIEDQFNLAIGRLQPFVDWALPKANDLELYGDLKQYAWWGRAMGSPKLTPDDTATVQPDPLRQRLAFALSEILVVSDRLEDLAVAPEGMANYYDVLLKHAFGNYQDLIYDVALHPCMGLYLSHLGNKKADPTLHTYPDENFAREIMQLFTIGLWELNPNGTRKLDAQGQPIPTYDNGDITELARVFTGLAFGGTNTQFGLWPRDFTTPMKMWDQYHDCDAKTLLRGLQLPAQIPSLGNHGTAGLADVRAAVSNLFNHPNVGPFLGKQLIQRFVTSNPSTNYVARVSAAFANNGQGVRGDMKALIKAILLDPEARDGTMMSVPHFGKLREPFLRFVNFARAFNALSSSGIYALSSFDLDHMQQPLDAPSVFNFFLPAYRPPGSLTDAGLLAPEFQIINASSVVAALNHYWNAILGDLHRWGSGRSDYSVRLNLTQEYQMVVPAAVVAQDVPNVAPFDPDPLLRRLDLALTGGQLSPRQFQIIRETLERLPRPSWQWHREYLRVAIYLVVTAPEFCVLK